MKQTLCAFVLVTIAIGLSACAVKSNPAQTQVVYPGGSVTYHCPPGQRKKGSCL